MPTAPDTGIKKYDVKVANNLALGQGGSYTETGTTAVTGNFVAIQILTDAVFSLLTETSSLGDDATTVTYVAGSVIYGQFTAFTLTSGAVRAYYGTPNIT